MKDVKWVLLQRFINFYEFFDRKISGGAVKNKHMTNQLTKQCNAIIRKFEKWKVYSHFIDNISGADIAGKQLISNLIAEFVFLRYWYF